ncbi:MAG: hypothetical protein K2K70_01625 [Lachnospiraceae bacterium]|nr:hypothetical protein [Lachnospiraceae bacterium]
MSNPFDKESLSQREKDILQDGGWQCSFCATINANYITTCACSHNRDDSYENLHGRYVPREDEEWTEAGITVEGPAQAVPAQEPIQPVAEPEPAFQPAQPVAAEPEQPEPAFQPASPVVEAEPAFQPASSAPTFEPAPPAPEPEPVAPPAAPEPAAPPVTEEPVAVSAPKAPVSNTNRPMEEYTEYEQGILRDGGWECAFCSRINANYITTCACGHSTDDSYLKRRGRYVDPDGEDQEEAASETTAQSASTPAAPQQDATSAEKPAAEKSGAEMITEIEQELQKNDTPTARLRAIRKFKDLNKKGFMSAEELNRRMDELMGFDDEEDEAESPEESTESEAAENSNDTKEEEEELELL